MLKKTLAVVALIGLTSSPALAQDAKALAGEGKGVIKQFAGSLVGEMKKGMKAGGPLNAISVCNTKAMPITDQVSMDTGWTVKRSSHKLRNQSNAPDNFENMAINEFLARQAKGEKAKDMAMAMTVMENGKKVFRMAKAIPTGEVCLTCHGSKIKPDVAAKLDSLYPEDKARGFSMGQMRGIFSLRKEL